MITGNQIVGARGLLHWRQNRLAQEADNLNPSTICAYENGMRIPEDRMTRIRQILEAEGIEFLNGPDYEGVLLRRSGN